MKIFHISDLHIGKQLKYYSLKESQEKVLNDIVNAAKEYRPDVIIIAGDVYDKSSPAAESYQVFNDFLNNLSDITPSIPVLIISGNHDNAIRLNYASDFMEKHNIFISTKPPENEDDYLKKVVMEDEYGKVNFYMLPFTKPGYVRWMFDEDEKADYNTAIEKILERENIDYSQRNVLIAHQFFVSDGKEPEKSESEAVYLSVGGIDSVDADIVQQFDYVALGHIHGPQYVGWEHIRYSGTPLKYSVSEEHHNKGITVVIMGEKNQPNKYETIPLVADRDVRSVKGTLEEVMEMSTEENRKDYVNIILTNEESLYRPKDILEEKYDNILEVRVENSRTLHRPGDDAPEEELEPLEAFKEFYSFINGQPLSDKEEEIMTDVISKAGEKMQ